MFFIFRIIFGRTCYGTTVHGNYTSTLKTMPCILFTRYQSERFSCSLIGHIGPINVLIVEPTTVSIH